MVRGIWDAKKGQTQFGFNRLKIFLGSFSLFKDCSFPGQRKPQSLLSLE